MAKKKGETYRCQDCGLVIKIENPCKCEPDCILTCCSNPMTKKK